MAGRVYLDWNATAPLRPEARAAMLAAMEAVGNPSSVHAEGRAARALVERARAQVADLAGCDPDQVVFTSGATEGARLLGKLPEGHDVFVQDTAHDCLWTHARTGGWQRQPDGHTLAMGLANGETGVITEPPAKVDGRWPCGAARADWLFLDVTQAMGRMPFEFTASGADFAILSAHKLGGPKGVGALIVRKGLDIEPLQTGGGQELGRRSGTENVAGVAGFGAAAAAAAAELAAGAWEAVAEIRNILEDALASAAQSTIFVGKAVPRLPNTSCLAVPGWKGETQVMQMDLAGFAVSAGSACTSGKVKASRVLTAMGFGPEVAGSAIRVSIGPATTRAEVLAFAGAWAEHHRRFRDKAA
jgi:cysteine desulfurase